MSLHDALGFSWAKMTWSWCSTTSTSFIFFFLVGLYTWNSSLRTTPSGLTANGQSLREPAAMALSTALVTRWKMHNTSLTAATVCRHSFWAQARSSQKRVQYSTSLSLGCMHWSSRVMVSLKSCWHSSKNVPPYSERTISPLRRFDR